MKRLIFISLLGVSLTACLNTTDKEKLGKADSLPPVAGANVNPQPVDSTKFTTIQWLDSSKSMGTMTQGEVLKISYRFRNSGTKPLVIERVQPACGCTVADYPKTPIAPGAEGEIKAEFDSNGKEGMQKKNVVVFANTAQQSYTLWFDVTINKKS
jgi:hypothetical protein